MDNSRRPHTETLITRTRLNTRFKFGLVPHSVQVVDTNK